jgi:HlyD family secretion protein
MALSRKRKIIIGSSVAVVLLITFVVVIIASRDSSPEVTTVKIEARLELRSVVTASGEVRPVQFINLTSEVAGRIEEIYVNPGDQVQRGQPLVRLDPTQLQSAQEAQFAGLQAALSDVQSARTQITTAENQVSQAQQSLLSAETAVAAARQQVVAAQSGVTTAETNVDRSRVDLASAQRDLARTQSLVESGAASRQELDSARDRVSQAQVTLRTSESQLRTAREQVRQQQIAVEEARSRVNGQRIAVRDARNAVERAQVGVQTSQAQASAQQARLRGDRSQLSKATQISPLTGVIADIPSKVGTFAVAGLSTTPLLTIADMSTINIEVNVDETEIADVEVGQRAKIKVDALGEKELDGAVIQKNPLAVGKSDTQGGGGISNRVNVQEAKEFKVIVQLQNLSDEARNSLRPGMTATADITTKVKQNVIAVPLQAIVDKSAAPAASPGATPSPTPTAPSERAKPQKGVYLLDGNSVKFTEVETGITGETDIEIVSGLGAGAEVITGPSRVLRTLKEGDKVRRQTKRAGAPGGANSNTKGGGV